MAESPVPLWVSLRAHFEGNRPQQIANALLRRFEVLAPPVPVERIVRSLGIALERRGSVAWPGALEADESRAIIYVNGNEAPVRQRFTIAHELGHLMMHPLGVQFRETMFSGSPKEIGANQFAAAMLMPLWMVEAAAKVHGANGALLCQMFDVSEQAMTIRLSQLSGDPVRWG